MTARFKTGRINLITFLILLLLFCGFIVFSEQNTTRADQDEIDKHISVIVESLWNLDSVSPLAYLNIAARHGKYESVDIYTGKDRTTPFISIKGPERDSFFETLVKLKLIPRKKHSKEISYNNRVIGVIDVVQLHDNIYRFFYVFLVLALIWLVLKFFIQAIHAKRTLEDEVQARTKELKYTQNMLNNIINSMPSILIGVDNSGKIIQWNAQARKITGIEAGHAAGRALADIFPRLAPVMEDVKESIQTRQIKLNQKQAVDSDRGTFYEDITIYPLMTNGVEGAVIRIDDVTQRVLLEEMMVQSEKMLSVGGLAAGMAHEINNPLAGMIQSASVMESRLTKMDMPANLKAAEESGLSMEALTAFMDKRGILRMISTIQESGARVAKIVENMLSFARKSDASFSSHDPAEMMDSILELAATDYDLKKNYDFRTIEIVREYQEGLPALPCEKGKIQQVLLNIINNGAEAMHEYLKDKTDRKPRFIFRLFKETGENMLRIEIEDNGPGMEENVRKRAFEPFFTTKPVGQGTGLGLSVSYFIITENHQGKMEVISEPGKGSVFIIRLPFG